MDVVRTARAASGIEHDGVLGDLREAVVRRLLHPLLPTFIGIGSGVIVAHTGEQSRQQDVVLYDTRVLPPMLFEDSGKACFQSILYSTP
jgi:hypothetical protein